MQDTKQKIDIYHISGDITKNVTSFNEMNMGLDRLYWTERCGFSCFCNIIFCRLWNKKNKFTNIMNSETIFSQNDY